VWSLNVAEIANNQFGTETYEVGVGGKDNFSTMFSFYAIFMTKAYGLMQI